MPGLGSQPEAFSLLKCDGEGWARTLPVPLWAAAAKQRQLRGTVHVGDAHLPRHPFFIPGGL